MGAEVRTRVKMCGVTSPEDASLASRHGADAVGIVFHPGSRRCVGVEEARAIIAALGPFVTVVGLFLDADPDEVRRVLAAVPIDCLQFHGNEAATYCTSFGRPYIKAAGMAGVTDLHRFAAAHPGASGLLVDSHRPGDAGGTGESFEWSRLPGDLAKPLILAGGLTPANVAEAVRGVRPWGVDVSTGVEQAPGTKDGDKLAAFMQGVQSGQSD